jgi:murein L,D-transpeptidase YcbB/YkuD
MAEPSRASTTAEDATRWQDTAPGTRAHGRALSAIASHAYRHGIRFEPVRAPVSVGATEGEPSVVDVFLRYAKAVAFGQMEPRAARVPWDIPGSGFDSGAAEAELRRSGLDAALASLPPPHPQYRRLVDTLASYRGIAARGGWPVVPNGPVIDSENDEDPRLPLLRRRLSIEGILTGPETGKPFLDRNLEQAVIRFQRRHGLEPDGRVGPRTLAALNVPVGERVAQVVANMERWRWMPRTFPLPRIEVNVAAAELAIVDSGTDTLRMRVVVGSRRHPTPLLESRVQAVVINPPWNVPVSIWRNEILPRLRHDRTYLASNDMRIVGRTHDPYGLEIDWSRASDVPKGIRFQQQPGPRNALGRVKFDIPNRFDVYLHDTPVPDAFKRPERALSHGCVRLEKPEALLRYLFRSREVPPRLPAAGDAGPRNTLTVAVAVPVPVFLVYWTAFVAPDGKVAFRDDIYGYDARITARLTRRDRVFAEVAARGCAGADGRT